MPPRDPWSFESSSDGPEERAPGSQPDATLPSAANCDFPRTILFVDDEPSILTVRRMLFEASGYDVLTALSGKDALAIMEANPVDLVVLDYLMPEMDGAETAMQIRRMNATIPIIFSTGSVGLPLNVLEIGSAVVHKVCNPQILIDAVEQRLQAPARLAAAENSTLHQARHET